jgi:excinuclease ABC subunit A
MNVWAMSVADAARLFEGVPQVSRILATLVDVGLGYVTLGQPAPQLSGGEAQRVKLSRELAKPGTGSTLYILDEPTTGLHFTDIEKLLHVLERLVDSGNTVLVVEHNLEVIAAADRVIDMGPEAGDGGGRIVVEGPPEDIAIHAARWRAAGGAEGSKGRPGNGPGSAGPAAGSESLLRSHTGEALERFGLPGLAGPTPAPTTSGSRGRTGRR